MLSPLFSYSLLAHLFFLLPYCQSGHYFSNDNKQCYMSVIIESIKEYTYPYTHYTLTGES